MVKITLKTEGIVQLQAAIENMTPEIEAVLEDVNNATGLELRGNIVKGYHEGDKVGIVYEKYNPRRTHQASAPGEAPASDTSRLANSIVFTDHPVITDSLKNTVAVYTPVAYGHYLEFGTMDIDPRPLWVPEAVAMLPKYEKRVSNAVAQVVKGK